MMKVTVAMLVVLSMAGVGEFCTITTVDTDLTTVERSVMSDGWYDILVKTKQNRLTISKLKYTCILRPYLKSCILLLTNPDKLRQLSQENGHTLQLDLSLTTSSSTLALTTTAQRKKRSLDATHSRRKRAVPGNPCADDAAQNLVYFYAKDSLTGLVVELLQDPGTNAYQYFPTKACISASYMGMSCTLQEIEYFAVVYTGNGSEVATRQVKIPTVCGIHALA